MAEIKPIRFAIKDAVLPDTPAVANETTLGWQYAPLASSVLAQHPPVGVVESVNTVGGFLDAAQLLDARYGADGVLPMEDAANAADEAMRAVADLQNQLPRLPLASELPAHRVILDNLAIGIGLWCMRHQLAIAAPEPVVNALARRINDAVSKQETAATYALMQGLLIHLKPTCHCDLERANPERPWHVLNINFAIAAIRTGDAAMMRYAFDCLNDALPDERAGFYAEAADLVGQPGFPAETRNLVEQEHRRFSKKR